MIGYGAKSLLEEKCYFDPISAAIIVGSIAFVVGGAINSGAARRQHEQDLAALEHDIEGTEILTGTTDDEGVHTPGQVEEQADTAAQNLLDSQALEDQLRATAEAQALTQAQETRDLSVENLLGQRDLGITQAGDTRDRVTERILSQARGAFIDVGLQQRGAQIGAARADEDLLVGSEMALGTAAAQIAASGVRGGMGSAAVIQAQTEAGYDLQRERVSQDIGQANMMFNATRGRIGESRTQGLADTNLAHDQAVANLNLRYDQGVDVFDQNLEHNQENIELGYDQQEARYDLQVDQAIGDIRQSEEFALERLEHDLDWMGDQLAYGESITSAVVGEAFLSGGVNLASSTLSFF